MTMREVETPLDGRAGETTHEAVAIPRRQNIKHDTRRRSHRERTSENEEAAQYQLDFSNLYLESHASVRNGQRPEADADSHLTCFQFEYHARRMRHKQPVPFGPLTKYR